MNKNEPPSASCMEANAALLRHGARQTLGVRRGHEVVGDHVHAVLPEAAPGVVLGPGGVGDLQVGRTLPGVAVGDGRQRFRLARHARGGFRAQEALELAGARGVELGAAAARERAAPRYRGIEDRVAVEVDERGGVHAAPPARPR